MPSKLYEQFSALGAIKSFSHENNILLFKVVGTSYSDAEISVSFYAGGILRYRVEEEGRTRFRFDLFHENNITAVTPKILKDENFIYAETEDIKVIFQKSSWKMEMYNKNGSILLGEFSEDKNARGDFNSLPSGFAYNNGAIPVSARINFELPVNKSFFGLGERFSELNRRNEKTRIWNDNAYGSGNKKSHKNIPFILSNAGYGIFLNETSPSIWDVGSTSNFSFSIETDAPGIDLFILIGSNMKEILKKYSLLTTYAPLPPRWSFGLWVSPFGNYLEEGGTWQQNEFLDFARTLREKKMPFDVMHLDPFWMGKTKKICDFVWDDTDFPDPAEFIQALRKMDIGLCLWEHPYIEKGAALYNEGKEKGYLLKRSDGSVYDYNIVIISAERRLKETTEYKEDFYALGGVVDFSNPDAVEWYKAQHRPLIEMGTATFKTDFGEVIPYDAHFHNGQTGREMHNIYSYLYNRTVWDVQSEYDDRPVLWGRSGYAGSQAFPVQWSGDPLSNFRSLGTTIKSGISYGLSGVPFWTFDLGGFKGSPEPEAYVRWSQIGLLVSHSRFHGTAKRMPWDFGPEAEKAVMKFIYLRYSLLPYLYASSWESVNSGLPVLRALSLEFEDDPGSYQVETEFLIGDSILVVPVLNAEGKTEVYLPPSDWYDFFSGKEINGSRFWDEECSLDELPIFVRKGSVISSTVPEQHVLDFWPELTIDFYGHGNKNVVIPEEGGRKNTSIESVWNASSMRLSIISEKRNFVLRFHSVENRPVEVVCSQEARLSMEYNSEKRIVVFTIVDSESFDLQFKEV
ncbi:TIM-barrel domain-containing protein [Marispirochaeta sp.]|uniref:TIM-barrel domain-containing protein n=1 Tax=Marispirochaeta sp. TaxID=2038653 RepID=UPI0029C7125D|nr:TIM-barrel domain-containing protein [Marispirochaeta sp.]